MGILFSRFRKKKTTIEILEDLDSKIKEIQQYGQTTEQRHKKIVGTLIICSVIVYVITALVFYFYFFPASLYDQLFYIIPLLMFPLVIIVTKKIVTWYYKRKISRNQEKLSTMQEQKKKILEDVTETETYKKAKEILMKFAPDQLRMTPLSPQSLCKAITSPITTPKRPSTPQAVVQPLPGAGDLRRRTMNLLSPPESSSVGSPLPRPILPQQRSHLDRLVEYLVGDGPSNRYALICHQCDSHNGMALKEEFEYFGFRCCYCNYWNPARKQKPSAPKLDTSMLAGLQSRQLNEADASSSSGTDSDIELVERPENIDEKTEAKISENITDREKLLENILDEQEMATKECKLTDDVQSDKMEVDESPRE